MFATVRTEPLALTTISRQNVSEFAGEAAVALARLALEHSTAEKGPDDVQTLVCMDHLGRLLNDQNASSEEAEDSVGCLSWIGSKIISFDIYGCEVKPSMS